MTAGPWLVVNGARSNIWNGVFGNAASYQVALVTSTSNISVISMVWSGVTGEVPAGNGYTTGGLPVTLADTGGVPDYVYFVANPTWTALGGTIAAYWAVLYKLGGNVLSFCNLDNSPATLTVTNGDSLVVRSDDTVSNPVFTLQ